MPRRLNLRVALCVVLALSVLISMIFGPSFSGHGHLVGAGLWHNHAGARFSYVHRHLAGAARAHFARRGGGHWH